MKKSFTLTVLTLINILVYSQNFEWVKQIGGTGNEQGVSITVDATGNVYTIGSFNAMVDFDPGGGTFNLNPASYDVFVSKLDANGNFIWAKQIGGAGFDTGRSITTDATGNLYITGSFETTADFDPGIGVFNLISAGSSDIFVSKLDSNGNFIWAKQMGGTDQDQCWSISTDVSGNIYTTGIFWSIADFDPGAGTFNLTSIGFGDIFISKLDANGNFIWAKQLGGPAFESGYSITTDTAGNVYTTGYFNGTADFNPGAGSFNLTPFGDYDIFVTGLDANGNFIWAKQMGGTGYDEGRSIITDAAGNLLITGTFSATTDFDPGVGTFNMTSAGSGDIFISKLDANGNFIWAKQIGGTGFDEGMSMAKDVAGNFYTTGMFSATTDFDPGVGTYNLTVAGMRDIFVYKSDTNGNFIWAQQMGGAEFDRGFSIITDASGNVYTTGDFKVTADFDPGAGMLNLTSAGDYDAFVHKISQCTSPTLSISSINPPCPGGTATGTATVNATGNAPFTYIWSNGQTTQTATGLTAGIHTVTVTDDSLCVASAAITITEPAATVSNVSSTPTNSTSPNCNGSVSINPTGGTPPYNISWSSGTTTNLCEGWYIAIITDANGCVQTDSVYVYFVTNIDELNTAGISAYPNPANDFILINSEKEIGEIKIYDVVGKLIYQELIKYNNVEIDVKEFNSGIYFIEINNARIKIVKM